MRYSLLLLVGLGGCSMGVYDGDFACKPGQGLGCSSVSVVNKQVDQGLGEFEAETKEAPEPTRVWIPPTNGQSSYLVFGD